MDIQLPYNLWRVLYWASDGDGAAVRDWREALASGALRLPRGITAALGARVRTVCVSDGETLASSRVERGRQKRGAGGTIAFEPVAGRASLNTSHHTSTPPSTPPTTPPTTPPHLPPHLPTTQSTIRAVHARGYMLDPHTAVGVAAALRHPFRTLAGREDCGAPGATVCLACAHPVKFASAVAEALGVSETDALRAMPDAQHACVRRVRLLSLAQAASAAGPVRGSISLRRATGAAPRGYEPGAPLPAGCCAVLRHAERPDWERRLRDIIEGLPAPAATAPLSLPLSRL
jgi:hypothetical protein